MVLIFRSDEKPPDNWTLWSQSSFVLKRIHPTTNEYTVLYSASHSNLSVPREGTIYELIVKECGFNQV